MTKREIKIYNLEKGETLINEDGKPETICSVLQLPDIKYIKTIETIGGWGSS